MGCCWASCCLIFSSASSSCARSSSSCGSFFSCRFTGICRCWHFSLCRTYSYRFPLGILISSKAGTQAQAVQLAFLPILPSVFFSGYIFPRETMPWIFHALSYLVPASYFVNITRGIILRGAGLQHLWPDALALFAMGAFLLVIAARRFQNKVIAS